MDAAHTTDTAKKALTALNQLIGQVQQAEAQGEPNVSQCHPHQQASATNLLHYLALRDQDLRDLQSLLGSLSISRLGRAESHVMASMLAVRKILLALLHQADNPPEPPHLSHDQGRSRLHQKALDLFGDQYEPDLPHVMVTFPSEAASQPHLVENMLQAGMTVARINCAHDGPAEWEQMIGHLRAASKKLGQPCRVAMDLGGPKLRTGSLPPGPGLYRIRPPKDELGRITGPVQVPLTSEGEGADGLPLPAGFKDSLQVGDTLRFRDTRHRKRELTVVERSAGQCLAEGSQPAYLTNGTQVVNSRTGASATVTGLAALESSILLRAGDLLEIHKDPAAGFATSTSRPQISCTLPQVLDDILPGEAILLDDGKFEGRVKEKRADLLVVEITFARGGQARLKADKGINLPESQLSISGLTAQDLSHLPFIVAHADIVNLSFVNQASDVDKLLHALNDLGGRHLGIVLKLETLSGIRQLPEVLLHALRHPRIGVMIARGDLAIESGWSQLAQVQQEVLWICEAAHVPIVWATQVLESMAKNGQPSRAEISDAAMAQGAECVMLNKGPHIALAIRLLKDILRSMGRYHKKKAPQLPSLEALREMRYKA